MSPGQRAQRAPTHADIEFENFLLQLKNQWSGSKTVCDFSIILYFKGIMTFESQRVHAFCGTKLQTLINLVELKMENPTHSFRDTNYALKLI